MQLGKRSTFAKKKTKFKIGGGGWEGGNVIGLN